MTESTYDRFGQQLAPGDAVEHFRALDGEGLGWRGGKPGKVVETADPQRPGRVLIELDRPTGYPAPYDRAREWAELNTIVRQGVFHG